MSATQTQSCHKCGRRLAVNARFCVNCGTSVSESLSSSGSADAVPAELGEMPDALFTLLQEETLGEYDLYAELGRGGMAAVYLALDLALNRQVAIKTMLPELISREGMVQRFKREAQTAARLNHPHIVQIHSVKETKRLVYFVMKYVEGRSLESVINERGKLDIDLARVILAQAGSALAFANRKGVVHRDVKPANIMLEEDGWAVLTDFGIAKIQEAQNLTATGTAIGTPHYMSPEQFHNQAVTGASDQYSLGIVAFEMLTGKKPFDGRTYAEIITQHLFDPPPDISALRPDVPPPVADAIARMLAKTPEGRFPTIDAAIAALGVPTQTQGELARTQMSSIAKSGPERKVRMSVPISPIPTSKGPRASNDVAGATGPKATAASAPAPAAPPTPRTWLWIGVAAAILVVAAGGLGLFGLPIINRGSGKADSTTGGENPRSPSTFHTVTTGLAELAPAGGQTTTASGATAVAPKIAPSPTGAPSVPTPTPTRTRADTASGHALASAGHRSAGDQKPVAAGAPNKTDVQVPTKDAASAQSSASVPPRLPTLQPPPSAGPTGFIRLASKVDGAQLFINKVQPKEPFAGQPANFRVAAGVPVTIHITARNCVAFDTTVQVARDSTLVVGRRGPTC